MTPQEAVNEYLAEISDEYATLRHTMFYIL